jgi:4-hydroxybenzoate polyprenyltransferase
VLLLLACHPEPVVLVTVLTTVLAIAAGRGWWAAWIAVSTAAGQLGVGWSNDYLDRDLDRAARRADKPLAGRTDGRPGGAGLDPATVRTAALVALAAAVPLSLAAGLGFAAAHLTAIACALAYNAGLKRRPLSVLPYTVAFGLLPVAVALAQPRPHWPPVWAVLAAALVGAGGHFTQALPDIPTDRALGVRGLPQVIGQRASGVTAALLLLAANLLVAFEAEATAPAALRALHGGLATALAAAIVIAAAAGRPRLAFRLTLAAAAAAVLAFVAGGSRL